VSLSGLGACWWMWDSNMDGPAPQPASAAAEDGGTSIRIALPEERLRSFVTFYYFVECRGELEDFLYPEWGNVRFKLSGSWWVESRQTRPEMPDTGWLFGPTDRAMKVISRRGATAGFGLTPLGWERFFDFPANEYANRFVPLGDALGTPEEAIQAGLAAQRSDEERTRFFDRLLSDRLEERPPNSAVAVALDGALRERPRDVGAFAEAAGVPPALLLRVAKRVFGFGPKRLLRRQRFLDTLGRIRVTEEPRFEDLRDPGYFDQAHFNHEFREFMGLSPREYRSVPRPLMGQAALVQLQAGIPLSFQLPPPPADAEPEAPA
jgi:AraC-like DNA-binding protein